MPAVEIAADQHVGLAHAAVPGAEAAGLAPPAFGRRGGSHRPGEDVDVLLLQQRLEPRQFRFAPSSRMAIEEGADQQIGFPDAAMMGTPGEAFQFRIESHGRPCSGESLATEGERASALSQLAVQSRIL